MQISVPGHPVAPLTEQTRALRHAAEELEASFLAEMLKPMRAGTEPTSFGGGIGESQFTSFLVAEEARAMARAGGIGLAEHIFRSLASRAGPGNG